MLKEHQRFDYVEESATVSPQAWRACRPSRSRRQRGLTLPVGTRELHQASTLPLQSYLQTRFPHEGGENEAAKKLQAENQRRFAIAMARGNARLSRTSGDWHPITPAEISAALAALEMQRLRETATPR